MSKITYIYFILLALLFLPLITKGQDTLLIYEEDFDPHNWTNRDFDYFGDTLSSDNNFGVLAKTGSSVAAGTFAQDTVSKFTLYEDSLYNITVTLESENWGLFGGLAILENNGDLSHHSYAGTSESTNGNITTFTHRFSCEESSTKYIAIMKKPTISSSTTSYDALYHIKIEKIRRRILQGDGTEVNPYRIYNALDLDVMRYSELDNSDLYYKVYADIDLSIFPNWLSIGAEDTTGVSGIRFKGHFDGGNYTISNMTIRDLKNLSDNRYGLFWYVNSSHSEVKNIRMSQSSITVMDAEEGVGFIAGSACTYGKINHIYIDSTCTLRQVADNGGNRSSVGGVVGEADGGEDRITECYSEATIIIEHSTHLVRVGGIVGEMGARMRECGFDGRILVDDSQGSVEGYIGGIAGKIYNAGHNLVDCFAIGKYGSMPDASFGGQEGDNYDIRNITSYSCFDSVGTSYSHGGGDVIGYWDEIYNNNNGDGYSITDVFFVKKLNGYYGELDDSEAIEPNDTNGTQITLSQLKDTTFLISHNWDFTNVWAVKNRFNGRPYLQWMDELVPQPILKSVAILSPHQDAYFSQGDSVIVSYETKHIDTVTVNSDTVMIAISSKDTTATKICVTSSGIFPIKVKDVASEYYDSISINSIGATELRINSASVILEHSVKLNVTASPYLENLKFYVGKDTVDMKYLGRHSVISENADYVFVFPDRFYANGEVWYKVMRDVDTSASVSANVNKDFVHLNKPRVPYNSICWYDYDEYKIGINRKYDGGCNWVNNATFYFYNFMLNTSVNDTLSWQYKIRECDEECRGNTLCKEFNCSNSYNEFMTVFNNTSGIDSVKTALIPAFNEVAPFEYGNRRFYLHAGYLMADDLAHSKDSIRIRKLDKDYFERESVTLSFLRYDIPQHNEVINYDGTASGKERALTKLANPFFLFIQKNEGWTYLQDVPKPTYKLIQNKYRATNNKVNYITDEFRGMSPKAIGTAKGQYKNNFPVGQ